VQERLAARGGVLLGKVGTFEFAIGGPSFDLPFPPARNPWNPDHFTGGSIRGPAGLCGIVGLKPTYGRVPRRGVFPLVYSLDHCGPVAWSVEDAALTRQVIAGYDPQGPASAEVPVPDFKAALGDGLRGVRIGYIRKFFIDIHI
jgi:aspartyl-tRNA(Asn)/glutamyl-tRNA(Gln) amidotransferase subunit A